MKKVLLIYPHYEDDLSGMGVKWKRIDQQSALKKLGNEVDSIYLSQSGIIQNGNIIYDKHLEKGLPRKIYAHFQFYHDLKRILFSGRYDIIYLRYTPSGRGLIHFLHHIKGANASVKIFIEFPTYPYESEYTGIPGIIIILRDRLFRNKLKSYADFAVTFSEDKEIYGIPCICIHNGINPDRLPVKKMKYDGKKLELIAVGKLWNWYGLDLLLKGIHHYYLQKKEVMIYLKIVGDGPEKERLQKMVTQLELEHYITFYGPKEGSELNDLFEDSDMGVGTLAIHRKEVRFSSSLKHREYFARGIPFFYCGKDPMFSKEESSILRLDEKQEMINMHTILTFISSLDTKSLKNRLKKLSSFTWEYQFQKVLDH